MTHRIFVVVMSLVAQFISAHAVAGPPAGQQHFFRYPTGNEDTIVFECNGRLWRYNKGMPLATPLTAGDVEATSPSISPNGQAVAYIGRVGADREVFLTSFETGETRRLTFDAGFDVKVQGWFSPTEVLYSTTIKSKKRGALLIVVNVDTLAARPLPLTEASEGCVAGDEFVFVKNEELLDSNRQYRGGYAQRLYKISMGGLAKRSPVDGAPMDMNAVLLSGMYEGASRNPLYVDGRVCFLSDRSGRFNIWSMKVDGTDLVQHTFEVEYDVKSISAWSGPGVLFQKMGSIYLLDCSRSTIESVEISMPLDVVQTHRKWSFDLVDAAGYTIANDGNTVVCVARGQLWAVDIASMTARCVLGAPGARVKSAELSSDGLTVFALADLDGEYEIVRCGLEADADARRIPHDILEPILDLSLAPDDGAMLVRTIVGSLYVVDTNAGGSKKLDLATRTKPQDISWSSDSGYAVFVTYSSEDIGRITLYDRQSGTIRCLTSGEYDVSSPVFAVDGSRIYYLAQVNYRSSSIDSWGPGNYWPAYDNKLLIYVHRFDAHAKGEVDDGASATQSRLHKLLSRELPIVAGNYDSLSVNGGQLHAYSKNAVRDRWGHVVALPFSYDGSRQAPRRAISDRILEHKFSKNGAALVALGTDGVFVVRAGESGQFGDPTRLRDVKGLIASIDVAREREQMYHELWRLYRDYFWDPGMAGVNWEAVREKYIEFLPLVSNRAEFDELTSYMIAELGAGHTAVGNASARPQDARSVGKLGCEFADGDGLYVAEIYDGDLDISEERSPLSLADPPVQVGDRIRRVNGLAVNAPSSLDRLLNGKVGATIVVTVEKPDGSLVDTRVSAISADHEAWLRRRCWAAGNGRYVETMSEATVGYIHLSASYEADFSQLVRQYAKLHRKQALIVDLRGNNGGNMDPWVLHLFQRRTWVYVQDRYESLALRHPRESFDGRLVVLIDGDTYSDGELIAEGVRRMGLGVLVGTRTAGAGKWVDDSETLIDGGNVRIPNSGSYVEENGKKTWVVEGRGVMPDIIVDSDPYQMFFGRDAQLRAAVDVALGHRK